jgi:hypothetical protein
MALRSSGASTVLGAGLAAEIVNAPAGASAGLILTVHALCSALGQAVILLCNPKESPLPVVHKWQSRKRPRIRWRGVGAI